jgi:serine/threonine protein phosphatase PrpC
MSQTCPNCKREVSEDDVYCANCGKALQPLQRTPVPNLLLNPVPAPPQPSEALEKLPEPSPVSLENEITQEMPAVKASTFADLAPQPKPTPLITATPADEDWNCAQCGFMNPGSTEYCEQCGAMHQPAGTFTLSPDLPTNILSISPRLKTGEGTHPGWKLRSSSGSNEGVSRRGTPDEDSVFSFESRRIFEARPESFGFYIVADGMGGQAAGEVASRMLIQHMSGVALRELALPWVTGDKVSKEKIGEVLDRSLTEAHELIQKYNAQEGHDSGTTATAACVVDDLVVFANIGDSRCYLWRAKSDVTPNQPTEKLKPITARTEKLVKGSASSTVPGNRFERVTRDHSYVETLVEKGEISRDEVYTHPRRNELLSAIGSPEEKLPVDIYERHLRPGDRLLLVSDGLWEMIHDDVIEKMIADNQNLTEVVDSLIALACQNGGVDNVSVILVEALHG